MKTRRAMRFLLIAFTASGLHGQSDNPKTVTEFMGRNVTLRNPGVDDFGFPAGPPSSICLDGPPRQQCYTAPEGFGRATVMVVDLRPRLSALLFSTASGGVSGWSTKFALLRPGAGRDLEDAFIPSVTLSNQAERAFWMEPSFSDAPIFLAAEYVWGPDESHYSDHRYIISVYALAPPDIMPNFVSYRLQDQYMTVRKYSSLDTDGNVGIVDSEKPEILARLKRVKAEEDRRRRSPK